MVAQILVVEDDDDSRSTVSELLTTHGFDVREAGDGRAALHCMLSMNEPCLVILDLDLPVMSGTELLEAMDGYHRLSRVPVLILSGSAHGSALRHAAVVGVISKPFDARSFVEAVKAHVRKVAGRSNPG